MEGTDNEMSIEALQTINEQICDNNEALTSLTELWAYWCRTHSVERPHDLISVCNMGQDKADVMFAKFITALKIPNRGEFKIDQITGIMYWLKLFYCKFLSHKPDSIIMGNGFEICDKSLNEKMKIVKTIRKNPTHISSEVLTDLEIQLWKKKVFVCDAKSFECLIDVVFFYIAKIFGILTGSCLCHLKIKHLIFGEDMHGQYFEISREFEKDYMRENDGRLSTMEEESNGIMLNVIGEKKFRHYNDSSNSQSFYKILRNYIKLLKAQDIEYVFVENKTSEKKDKESDEKNFFPMSASQIEKLFTSIIKKAGDKFAFIAHPNLGELVFSKLSVHCLYVDRRRGNSITRHLDIGRVLDPPSTQEMYVVNLANKLKLQADISTWHEHVLYETGIMTSTLSHEGETVGFFFKFNCFKDNKILHVLHLKAGTSEPLEIGDCCKNDLAFPSGKDKFAYSLISELQKRELDHQRLVWTENDDPEFIGRDCLRRDLLITHEHTPLPLKHNQSAQVNTKQTALPLQQKQSEHPKVQQKGITVPLKQKQRVQPCNKLKVITIRHQQSAKPQSTQKFINVPLQQNQSAQPNSKPKIVKMSLAQVKSNGKIPLEQKRVVFCSVKGKPDVFHGKSEDSEASHEKHRKLNDLESETRKHTSNKRTKLLSNSVSSISKTNDNQMIYDNHQCTNNPGNVTDTTQQICELDLPEVLTTDNEVADNSARNTTCNSQVHMDTGEISQSDVCNANEDYNSVRNDSRTIHQDLRNSLTIEYAISNESGQSQTLSINDESNDCHLSFPPNFTVGKLKDVSDLDINLGNYLPENIRIRPSDISLKRVVTPDGGKFQISLKYKSSNEQDSK